MIATPLSVDKILATYKKWGVKYVEVRSWRSHNRNTGRAWGPMNGIVIHHTASSNDAAAVKLCYDGRSDLPGPLCHAVGTNDGKMHLVGHGRANHAGNGDPDVLNAVINETPLPATNQNTVDGNARFYGLEIVNAGDNKDVYSEVQYLAAVLWAASICDAHGWNEKSVIGHKEWTNQKIDPRGPVEGRGAFNMDTFRADVKAVLAHGPNGDTDVALTDADVRKILTTDGIIESPTGAAAGGNTHWTAGSYLRETYLRVQELRAELAAARAEIQALALDADGTAAAVAASVEAKLEGLSFRLESGDGA